MPQPQDIVPLLDALNLWRLFEVADFSADCVGAMRVAGGIAKTSAMPIESHSEEANGMLHAVGQGQIH